LESLNFECLVNVENVDYYNNIDFFNNHYGNYFENLYCSD